MRERSENVERERPVQHHEDDAQCAAQPSAEPAAEPVATPVADGEASSPQGDAADQQPATTGAPVEQPPADAATVPTALLAAVAGNGQPKQQEAPEATAQVAAQAAPAEQKAAPSTVQVAVADPSAVKADAAADVAAPTAEPATAEVANAAAPSADQAAATAARTDAQADSPELPDALQQPKPKSGSGATGQQAQQGQQQGQQGGVPQQGADQARTLAQPTGRNDQPQSNTEVPTAPQSGTPAASPVTQVAGGQPAAARGGLTTATPVPLSRAAEAVEQVMRLSAGRGVTHARITLNPESLGSVDVHLRHTADGLVARVMAHSPEAVQQLQQAAADLRRQLEDQGVNLLGLDIGQSAGEERSAGRAGAQFGEAGRENGGRGGDGASAGDASEAEVTVNSTLQLPNGVLVDVLA